MGVKVSKSNGHERELDKEGHMMKIIEKLQKDAQNHRTYSRKLRKTQYKQGEFNLKLMKSLERIEKKLDQERYSSKTKSHPNSEGRRSRSVGKHHHHSQGHSKRRAHSSSSPYPTRKHRRYGVDKLKEK